MPYRAPACPQLFCHHPMFFVAGESELEGSPPFYVCDNCGAAYTVEAGDMPGRRVETREMEETSRGSIAYAPEEENVAQSIIDQWNNGAWEEIPGIGWWYRGGGDVPEPGI